MLIGEAPSFQNAEYSTGGTNDDIQRWSACVTTILGRSTDTLPAHLPSTRLLPK